MTEKQKTIFGVLVGLIPLAFSIPLEFSGKLNSFENSLIDIRYALFNPNHDHSDDVLILDLDEQTLNTYKNEKGFGRWPWNRNNWSPILKFINEGNPRGILFDVMFTESTDDDKNLAEITASIPTLAHSIQMRLDEQVIEEKLPAHIESRAYPVQYDEKFIPDPFNIVQYPAGKIGENAALLGCVTYRSDPDNISRMAAPTFKFHDATFLSLPLLGYVLTYDPVASITISSTELFISGTRDGQPKELRVPLENGKLRLHYYPSAIYDATARKSLHRVSLSGVIDSIRLRKSKSKAPLKVSPELFAGKIVLISTSASATFDEKLTPYGPHPGYVLHATVLSNLLNEHFLHTLPRTVGWITALILVGLTGFFVLRFQRMTVRVLVPILLFLLCTAATILLFYKDYAFYYAPVPVTFVPSFLGMISVLSYFEGAEKRRFKGAMSKYLSPDVLEEVMKKGELKAEVGERKVLTVLFSDVRGFTTISENLAAEEVVSILNHYFSRMVKIIFDNKGTLDKFIGDAIMAFWGAPSPRSDHAILATRSAIEMTRALRELNKDFTKEGHTPVAIGIGVNTGEMIVGNIGSDQRLDYTIIGDNVNLGSRMESLTKLYGVEVLIAESTMKAVHFEIPCRIVDLVAVKGKTIPVPVYEPLEENTYHGMNSEAVTAAFERAFQAYRSKNWDQSISIYNELSNARNGGDKVAQMMIERCRYFIQNPPNPEWDGAFIMRTK